MASRTINIPATTNLDADELTSGTVPFARLSVGTGSTQVAADISVANCSLSGPALDAIYANLATASKTITVTGNYGTASDTPSIATAKGWTVVGS